MIGLWIIGYLVAGCVVAAVIAFIDGAFSASSGLDEKLADSIPFIVLLWPAVGIAMLFGMFGKLLCVALENVHDWAYERFGKK